MRLADFILENIEPILQQWEDFAKTMTPAANGMDSVALRDHAEQMLLAIAADLRDNPIGEDELNRARRPALERLRRSMADNGYWLTQLSQAQSDPATLSAR